MLNDSLIRKVDPATIKEESFGNSGGLVVENGFKMFNNKNAYILFYQRN